MAQSVINTFDKGLHQDSAFILQPDGTYRNMKNGMLISYDGNHYTIELAKGNTLLFSIPAGYVEVYTDRDIVPAPIGFISFIDKLVVFSTNDETDGGGRGEIGVVTFTKLNDTFTASYIPYYNHESLFFSKQHQIEGYSNRENDLIERCYWTDNNNEPRVFDIANPIFTTYIADGDLVVGKYYMVVSGVIIHNVTQYGPGISAGNVFKAVNINYSATAGTVRVIEYYPFELLNWNVDNTLGNIQFFQYLTGNVTCGSKVYFYRLASSRAGYKTTWSYPSAPIHVGKLNESDYITSIPYHNFVGAGSPTTEINSNYSVTLFINNLDTNFDTVEVACAEFDQLIDTPRKISIVAIEKITASTMLITHDGLSNFGTVTINELTQFPASINRIKTLTTSKNYNVIGNIHERKEFTLDLTGVTLSQFEHPLISHGDLTTNVCTNLNVYGSVDIVTPDIGINPVSGTIRPNARYWVMDADLVTNTVVYNGVNYVTGDIIVGVSATPNITYGGAPKVRPAAVSRQYTSIVGSKDRFNALELSLGYWDYKDPAIDQTNRGYWSNEKYRFGILFYDKKRNPFYVRHIGDYTFSDIYTKTGLLVENLYNSKTQYSLNPSGLQVDGLTLPQDIVDQISGFSIVRCERDARIISQGLVSQVAGSGATSNPISAIIPVNDAQGGDLKPRTYTYICPDWNVGFPFKKTFDTVDNYLEEAIWMKFFDFGAGVLLKCDTGDGNYVSKMFVNMAADSATPRKKKIDLLGSGSSMISVNEAVVFTDFDGAGKSFDNTMYMSAGGELVNIGCAGTYNNLGNDSSVGCKKLVLKLVDDFQHWSTPGFGYTDNANNGLQYKILMNMVNPISPSEQYGGNSETAIAKSLYISTGHFQEITASVLADNDNGNGTYTFNGIEVFGGDCYTNLIDQTYGLWGNPVSASLQYSYTNFFPCECNSNYNLRRGRKASNVNAFNTGSASTKSIAWNATTTPAVRLEDYSYNQGYSTEGQNIKYPALPINYINSGTFETRTRFAGQKTNGEIIDTYRVFLQSDYKDMDSSFGEVNNVRTKTGRVFVWQNKGVSYVPILERQLLGAVTGAATTIGTGGVLDRFDPTDSYFGNQHQHGLTETEYGFIWFDMRRRALMVMVESQITELSIAKGLQVFFNNEFNEGDVAGTFQIYNTNNYSIKEVPLMGYGITGCYDPRFKMSYLTFKYTKDETAIQQGAMTSVCKDFTIGYNHTNNVIVGFFDNTPAIWKNHNDLVLTANNPKNTKSFNSIMPTTVFEIGDTVSYLGSEYICKLGLTIVSYPGTTTQVPDYGGSIYWDKINSQNQVWINTFSSEMLKFYGKTWSHELEVIVNPRTEIAVSPQNIQFKGNETNWTDVYAYTDDQSAQDVNISATNRNYRWIDKAWFSSLPFSRKGRLTDYYVRIKFVYKGYVTYPTISKNVQKLSQWLKTFFVSKR